MFLLNKSLTQSPLILTNSLVDTDKPENKCVFCHQLVTFYNKGLQFNDYFTSD